MRATCNHAPRRLIRGGGKHKDGSPVMVCADCRSIWHQRHYRKKSGFAALWDQQRGLCAFCLQMLADDNTTHRDHNHATGEVRGLVHAQCNQMIGGIENAVALVGLERIGHYLAS
jgi:recombination endonuclease VII